MQLLILILGVFGIWETWLNFGLTPRISRNFGPAIVLGLSLLLAWPDSRVALAAVGGVILLHTWVQRERR